MFVNTEHVCFPAYFNAWLWVSHQFNVQVCKPLQCLFYLYTKLTNVIK